MTSKTQAMKNFFSLAQSFVEALTLTRQELIDSRAELVAARRALERAAAKPKKHRRRKKRQ